MTAETQRIRGYDLARAVAILAMVIVNFSSMMGVVSFNSIWIQRTVDFLYGRAAALFVMLAGVSISLMAARNPGPEATRRLQVRLLKRGALLLAAGLALHHWWTADILRYYAVFLAVAAGLIYLPDRRSIGVLAAAVLISLPVSATLTTSYEMGDLPSGVENLGLLPALIWDYLAGSYYSLLPWACFFLAGMLLGRIKAADRTFHRRCAWGGLLTCLAVEMFSKTMLGWFDNLEWEMEGNWWLTFFRSDAFPVTPLFIFSSGASAVAMIGLCCLLSESGRKEDSIQKGLEPLVIFGQFSLTMYIAHLLWGGAFMALLPDHAAVIHPGQMFAAALSFYAASIAFAGLWRRFFRRGPLETVFHWLISYNKIVKDAQFGRPARGSRIRRLG
ncbi:MAG: heparan-alpha-glucosaminide N-acetyltransferase domain-containing protein [Desulfosarcinaceae bacterium]